MLVFFFVFAVSPLNVRINPEEQPLTAQRKYDLVCESVGSRPPAKLTWYKDNSRLERTKDLVSTYLPAFRQRERRRLTFFNALLWPRRWRFKGLRANSFDGSGRLN